MNIEFKQLSELSYSIKSHILSLRHHSCSSDIKDYGIIVVRDTGKHCIYCDELYKKTIEDIPNLKLHTLYRFASIIVDNTYGYTLVIKNRFGCIDRMSEL